MRAWQTSFGANRDPKDRENPQIRAICRRRFDRNQLQAPKFGRTDTSTADAPLRPSISRPKNCRRGTSRSIRNRTGSAKLASGHRRCDVTAPDGDSCVRRAARAHLNQDRQDGTPPSECNGKHGASRDRDQKMPQDVREPRSSLCSMREMVKRHPRPTIQKNS